MAIEFRCAQCARLLRAADEAAGKQVQCPECQAICVVPPAAAMGGPQPAAAATPFGPGQPNPYQSPAGYGSPVPPARPAVPEVRNYLVQAILCTVFNCASTLFCCLPVGLVGLAFGVVAIVFASQVNGRLTAGDYPGALSTSNRARTWCWISFWPGLASVILGLVTIVLYIIFVVASGLDH